MSGVFLSWPLTSLGGCPKPPYRFWAPVNLSELLVVLLLVLRYCTKGPHKRSFLASSRATPGSAVRIESVVDGSSNKICPNDSVIGYLRGHAPLLFVVRANFVEHWVELVGKDLERHVYWIPGSLESRHSAAWSWSGSQPTKK